MMILYRVVDGRQIRAARAMLGMTVRELATAAGVNRNSISRAEASEKLPSIPYVAERVAKYAAENGVVCEVIDGEPSVRIARTDH